MTRKLEVCRAVEWYSVDDAIPDADTTVLIYSPKDSEPVWVGFHDGDEGWRYCNGGTVSNRVTHWAELPEGPR